MKLFQVTIDNDPGAWKSGHDKEILVPANSAEEAIQLVKTGEYGECWDFENHKGYIGKRIEGLSFHAPYIASDAKVTALEIEFLGYVIKSVRQSKIEKILNKE